MSGTQQTSPSSYVQRQITATFTLANGVYAESGTNQVTVSGLRMSADIVKAGGLSMGETQLRIFGLTLSLMNQLSTLGKIPLQVPKNIIAISAGDAVSGLGVVFIGTIYQAWADFQGMPDTVFNVTAYIGLYEAINPVAPSSYNGPASVATIMSSLATQMGLTFENAGVQGQLSSPYFPGTARMQAEACAKAADINWAIDDDKMAIWPKGGSRGGSVPLVSPSTGMRGYPAYTSTGIVVETLFNPAFSYGAKIQVQSSLTPANGTWVIYKLAHSLECQVPDGAWFTRIEAAPPGYVPVS